MQAAGLEPTTALLLVELVGYMGPEDLQVRGGRGEGQVLQAAGLEQVRGLRGGERRARGECAGRGET